MLFSSSTVLVSALMVSYRPVTCKWLTKPCHSHTLITNLLTKIEFLSITEPIKFICQCIAAGCSVTFSFLYNCSFRIRGRKYAIQKVELPKTGLTDYVINNSSSFMDISASAFYKEWISRHLFITLKLALFVCNVGFNGICEVS